MKLGKQHKKDKFNREIRNIKKHKIHYVFIKIKKFKKEI